MTSLAEIFKALPPDSLLSAAHVAAIVEAAKEQNFSQWDNQRYIDEKTLADWIGEAVPTVKSWRSKGTGPKYLSNPKNVRYQVGHVRDWLNKRTVASTSEATVKGLRSFLVEGTTAFPVFTYTDGLKLSLDWEEFKTTYKVQIIQFGMRKNGDCGVHVLDSNGELATLGSTIPNKITYCNFIEPARETWQEFYKDGDTTKCVTDST